MRNLGIFILTMVAIFATGCHRNNDYYDRYDRYNERDRYDRYHRYEDQRQVGDKYVLLEEHNRIRNDRDAKPLQMDRRLEEAAKAHVEWMARNEKLSHTGEDESTVYKRVGSGYQSLAENIAYGYRGEREVMQAWMDSYGHRKNIINQDLKYIGFGVATSKDGTVYWCAVFGA